MKTLRLGGAQTSCLWGTRPSWLRVSTSRRDARSPQRLAVAGPSCGGLEGCATILFALLFGLFIGGVYAENEPILVVDAVDCQKLLPILPDAPQGWLTDKPDGSTQHVGGFTITNVHRDYRRGEGDK